MERQSSAGSESHGGEDGRRAVGGARVRVDGTDRTCGRGVLTDRVVSGVSTTATDHPPSLAHTGRTWLCTSTTQSPIRPGAKVDSAWRSREPPTGRGRRSGTAVVGRRTVGDGKPGGARR